MGGIGITLGGSIPFGGDGRHSSKLTKFDTLMNFEKRRYRGPNESGITLTRGGGQFSGTDLIWLDPPGRTYATFNNSALRLRSGTSMDGLLFEIGALVNLASVVNNPTGTVTANVTGTSGSPVKHCVWVNAEAGGTATVNAGTATITITGTGNVCSHMVPVYFTCTSAGVISIPCVGTIYTIDVQANPYPTSHINVANGSRGAENATLTNFPITNVTKPYMLLTECTMLTPDLLNPNPAVIAQIDANVNMSNKLSNFRRVTGGVQLARAVSDNTIDFPGGPPGNTDMGNDVWPVGVRGRMISGASPGEQKECWNGGAVSKAFMAHMPDTPTKLRIGNGLPGVNFHAGSMILHQLGIANNLYMTDAAIRYDAHM